MYQKFATYFAVLIGINSVYINAQVHFKKKICFFGGVKSLVDAWGILNGANILSFCFTQKTKVVNSHYITATLHHVSSMKEGTFKESNIFAPM